MSSEFENLLPFRGRDGERKGKGNGETEDLLNYRSLTKMSHHEWEGKFTQGRQAAKRNSRHKTNRLGTMARPEVRKAAEEAGRILTFGLQSGGAKRACEPLAKGKRLLKRGQDSKEEVQKKTKTFERKKNESSDFKTKLKNPSKTWAKGTPTGKKAWSDC